MKSNYFSYSVKNLRTAIIALLICAMFGVSNSSWAQTVGDFQTNGAVTFSTTTNWQRWNGTTWVTPAAAPITSDGVITIRNGHTATVGTNRTIDQLVVATGGTLTISTGAILTIANGTGTDLSVDGTVNNSGTMTPQIGATILFNANSTYNHTRDSGTIPAATWNATSNCNITGITTSTGFAGGLNQTFGNFTWNCPSQVGNLYMESNITIAGDFTVLGTGTFSHTVNSLRMSNSGTGYTMTVSGNVFINANSTFKMSNNSGLCTLNVGGNLTLNGGNFTIATGTTSPIVNVTSNVNVLSGTFIMKEDPTADTGILNIGGNFTFSGGTITQLDGGSGSGSINFTGNTTHTYSKTGGTFENTINFNVSSGSTLNMGTSLINGSTGSFTLNSGAGIITAHAQGLSTLSGTGSIQVTGTKTYSTGANYNYNGATAQVTGNGLPSTVSNLTISNASGVTLNAAKTIANNFSITSGSFVNLQAATHSAGTLTLGSVGTPSGSWGSTISSATYKNNTYFASTTGIVNVATATCIPSPPTVTGSVICTGTTATLSASGATTGEKYKWYNASTGGTLLKISSNNTDNTYTTAILASTTNYWVAILSATGCESSRTLVTATINTTPAVPGTITQPPNKCSGSSGNIFSITPVSGATSYTWSVTGTGWVVTAGGTTTSATITIGTGIGTVSVTATNGCGTSAASTTGNITPTTIPATPGTITQPTNKCSGSSGNIFSIAAVSGATSYTWSATGTGWAVNAGGTTTSATITIGTGMGTVSVTATNGCGTSTASTTGNLTPTTIPATPGTITQPTNKCSGSSGNIFSITPVSGASSYTWSVTGTGWAVTAGGTTTSATITIGTGIGTVSVTATNGCGTSSASTTGNITPTTMPATPGTITGLATQCSVLNGQAYSIAAVPNATTYIWTVPTGWTITAGSTTTSITVTTGIAGQNGNITVKASNSCFTSTASTIAVTVNTPPTISPNKIDETCPASNNGSISPVLSGGLSNVRYIKLTQKYINGDAWQQVQEIQAFEIFTGTNVALVSNGASATASSIYSDPSTFGPQKAIDGDYTGYSFWHSNSTNTGEWIKVDLASSKNIDYLRIYNRADCCQERGQNMLLELFDATNTLVYSKTIDLYQSGASIPVNVNVLDVSWADAATTLNRTALNSGTYTLNYADAVGCSVSEDTDIAQPANNVWNGSVSADWNDPANWCSGVPTNGLTNTLNVLIPSSGVTYYPIIYAGAASGYVKTLVLEINTTLNVRNNSLRVTDNLKLDGKIDLEDESQLLQDLGSILDPTSSGTLERDQQGTADKFTYNYWASPVNTINNNSYKLPDVIKNIGFLTSGYDGTPIPLRIADYWIWKFSNKTSGDYSQWQHIRSTGTILVGEGFTMKGPGTGSIPALQNYVFEGKPNNGDINLTISAGMDYLVGNPYPSALDANQFILDNGATIAGPGSTTGTLYFWQHWGGGSHILSEYQGGYATYTLADGIPAPFMGTPPPGFLNNPGPYIPVAQGFFVVAETSGTIKFNNGQRAFKIEDGIQSAFIKSSNTKTAGKQAEDIRTKLRLGLNSVNQIHRELLVTVDPITTPGYDWGYDAPYIDELIDDMYWLIDTGKYTIQGIDRITEQTILPLGIHTKTNGLNSISINKIENASTNLKIYLYDKQLNIYHNLKESNYDVYLTAGEYLNRFEITFSTSQSLDLDNPSNIDIPIEVYFLNKNKNLIIDNSGSKYIKSIEMFNLLGQSMYKFEPESNKNHLEYNVSQISTGVYIFKIKTEFGKITKKILIK